MSDNDTFFLQKFEKIYNEQVSRGPPSAKAQFEYSWCLVRSRNKHDVRKGVALLEGEKLAFALTDKFELLLCHTDLRLPHSWCKETLASVLPPIKSISIVENLTHRPILQYVKLLTSESKCECPI